MPTKPKTQQQNNEYPTVEEWAEQRIEELFPTITEDTWNNLWGILHPAA